MQATVTIQDLPDGSRVTIEYSDGHTVRMLVGRDSIVLKRHLGLDDPEPDITPMTPHQGG